MRQNLRLVGILMMAAGLIPISCTLKSSLIGRSYNTTNWCQYPAHSSCDIRREHLALTVNRLEMVKESEYLIEGFMEILGISPTFRSILVADTTFYLVLAMDNKIVEVKIFFPAHIELHTKFPFSLKFKSPAFDSYIFGYEIGYSSGQPLT